MVDSVYDNRNRLTQTSAPHNATEASISQRVLDENSNLTSLIDPNGNASTNQYDAFNRLDSNTHRENDITQVTASNSVVTQYEPVTSNEWSYWLALPESIDTMYVIINHTEKGLPCGSEDFICRLERLAKRPLHYRSQGRPTKG